MGGMTTDNEINTILDAWLRKCRNNLWTERDPDPRAMLDLQEMIKDLLAKHTKSADNSADLPKRRGRPPLHREI